jgi:hypothetical protein
MEEPFVRDDCGIAKTSYQKVLLYTPSQQLTDSDLNSRQWTKRNANRLRHPLFRAPLAAFLQLD